MRIDLHEPTANTTTRRLVLSGAVDRERLQTLLAALEHVAWFRLEDGVLSVAYDVGRLDFAALATELEQAGFAVDESGFKRWRGAFYRLVDRSARANPVSQPTCCGEAPPPKPRGR